MMRRLDWESEAFWLGLARAAGLYAAGIGAVVLLGWQFDAPLLKSIHPAWVAMKTNTAVGLVLAGLALWLSSDNASRLGGRRAIAVSGLAGAVVMLGLLTLFEYGSGRDLGIDQWLFREPPAAIGTLAPNRMAPTSALCFLLLGSALWLGARQTTHFRGLTLLASSAFLLTNSAALIYLYNTQELSGIEQAIQLAVHTIVAFYLLSLGILCARPRNGIVALLRRRDSGGAIARRALPVTLLLPMLIGGLTLAGEDMHLYHPDFGVALVALAYVVILSGLVLLGAGFLSQNQTERERMHAAIAEHETQLRTLVQSIPDLIWLKSPDGVYLSCNPAFERFFGADEADIVGKTDYDFVPRELADFFRAKDTAAVEAGGPSVNEEWITYPDGAHVLVETTKTPMRDAQGRLLGVLGIARDITARQQATEQLRVAKAEAESLLVEANLSKRALLSALEDTLDAAAELRRKDETLRASQARYVSLFDAIADGVLVHEIGEDGGASTFFEVNEVACRLTGYLRAELLRMTPLQLDACDSGNDLGPVIQRLISGRDATFEQVFLHKEGHRVPVEIHAHLFILDGRKAVISIVRDISERKQAELALRKSETALREAQHLAKLGNWKWDTQTNTHTWSAEIFEFYGRDPALGPADIKEVPRYFTPESWSRLSAAVDAGLKLGQSYECDAEVVRPDGSHRWITARGKALYDDVGNLAGLVGTVQDITDRKQAEEALRRLNEELEQRVAVRTADLSAANKELEAFSYSVSHDLRAPLRAISGFVGLLRKHNFDRIDDKGRHYMDVIADSAVKMGQLIDDILTFSRIGRVEMHFTSVRLDQVLLEVLELLQPQVEARVIEWKIGSLPEVRGERTLLSLVLQNLVANALKFTRTRAAAVIEIGCAEAGNETVCYVRDNGVGFDMRYVDKLFGLFQRLHSQESFEGTGVGLANVQRIVQRHGGRVWAEGRVDEGATFYFALPKTGD